MATETLPTQEKPEGVLANGCTSNTTSRPQETSPSSSNHTATTPASNVEATETEQNLEHDVRQPRLDGGREAWTQVLASFLINMNVYGLVNAFGDFQRFYETEYLSNYSPSTISWIGTVQASLTLIIGALAGPVFDKGYFTTTLRGAAVALVFSWMMLSLSTQYYQIMLTQGILAGVCVGLMEVPSIAILTDYFQRRLGLALGLGISGASAGGLIYSAVFRAVLDASDFGWATRAIGFIVLGTLGIAVMIIRPKDSSRKENIRGLVDLSAFRELPFVLMFADAFFAFLAALVPFFITPSFAASLGTSSGLSYHLVVVLNSAQFFGRLIPAALTDVFGGADMLLFAQVLIGLLGLHWITVATLGGFIEFVIYIGVFTGMLATLPATVIPFICPDPATIGTRIGMLYGAAGVGVLIGNPIALAVTGDTSTRQGFLGAQLWMGICALIGAAFFVLPSRTAKRNRKSVLDGARQHND